MKWFRLILLSLATGTAVALLKPDRLHLPMPTAETLSWSKLAMPLPAAGERIASGDGPALGELRLEGDGPFPVVVLIHGGCWKNTDSSTTRLGAGSRSMASPVDDRVSSSRRQRRRLARHIPDVANACDFVRQISHIRLIQRFTLRAFRRWSAALWLAVAAKFRMQRRFHREADRNSWRARSRGDTDLAKYRIGPAGCHASVEPLLVDHRTKFKSPPRFLS
jgi:hypothetical protein